MLREIDTILRGELRDGDVVGRHSADALAVILPEAPLDTALTALARPAEVFRRGRLHLPGGDVSVTLQIGVAALDATEEPGGLLARAAAAASAPGEIRAAGTPAIAMAESSPALAAGHVVANAYRILHQIGEGGVGRVYRAEDITLQRPVALKVLRPELAKNPEFLTRFRSEAALLAQIQHPNLVQIFTLGDALEGTYFAMELVEGETLADAIVRNAKAGATLPMDRLLRCLAQIAAALDCLHQHGVLHRDVKPDNFALDPFRDRAVLLDVGVAQRVDVPGIAAGTPGFVAPEVLYQHGGESTPSDVFGLAVSAFHALTYRHPWASFETNAQQIVAEPDEPIRRASELRPELAPVDELFVAALSFDPKQRPRTAGELVSRLSDALVAVAATGETGETRPVTGRLPALKPAEAPTTLVDFRELSAETPPQTRGVVFKAVARVVDPRDLPRWLEALAARDPELAGALTPERPGLAWVDAHLFFELLDAASALVKEPDEFARRYGRAVIRSSFQRFFPASASTLAPERILASLPAVWARYQTWGRMTTIVDGGAATVALDAIPQLSSGLPWWFAGVLEQTVTLCGGEAVDARVVDAGGTTATVEVRWASTAARRT